MHDLDINLHLLIQGHSETGAYYSESYPVEGCPVEAYLERSLEHGRPVGCSMMGAFAIWSDGKLWIGYSVAGADDEAAVPIGELLVMNALDTTLAMIWGVSELLDGKTMVDLGSHDDEDPIILHVDADNLMRYELKYLDIDSQPIPFLPFARLVLREGEKMYAFSLKMLDSIQLRLAAEPAGSPHILPLEHRIELINWWDLGNTLQKLRSQLEKQP